MHWLALVNGFLLSASLIIAIGSQNAFVLKQGIRRESVWLVASICFFCEALLISLGAMGVGTLVSQSPGLLRVAAWGGALFLFIYGGRAFYGAVQSQQGLQTQADGPQSAVPVAKIVAVTLAVTLLNPHVYLDTVVLLGSIAGQYPLAQRGWFVVGALIASCTWFYGLAFGARLLAPLLAKPKAWRVLDGLIGLVMWAIALSLLRMAHST